MDLGLSGRACVVTGASRGIGRETARLLCAEGAERAAGRSRRGAARATPLEEAAARRAAGAEALALDVTDADAGERMLAAASERFGAPRRAGQQRRRRQAGATSTRSPTRTGAPSTS